jgi:hypothetical protein
MMRHTNESFSKAGRLCRMRDLKLQARRLPGHKDDRMERGIQWGEDAPACACCI